MKHYLKTTLLLGAITGLFLAVGYILGGNSGAIIALVIAAISNFGMFWFSSSLVLKMQGAKPLDTLQYGYISTMIKDLANKDNLPMPKLFFVDTPIPNAFATGRNKNNSVVAVTRGITEILNHQELKAVLAHELGHIKNRDMLVSTIAATLGGAISFLAQMAIFGSMFGNKDEEGNSNPIAGLAMLILAPLAATLIQMSVSRSREFLADRHSATLIGDGNDLANALHKLDNFKHQMPDIEPTPTENATAHLMFMNMFNAGGLTNLFSTHPSTESRVRELRKYS